MVSPRMSPAPVYVPSSERRDTKLLKYVCCVLNVQFDALTSRMAFRAAACGEQ